MEIREAIRAVRAALRDLHEVLVDDTATWARASEEFDEQTKSGFTPRQAQNIRDDRGTIMAQFERDDGRWSLTVIRAFMDVVRADPSYYRTKAKFPVRDRIRRYRRREAARRTNEFIASVNGLYAVMDPILAAHQQVDAARKTMETLYLAYYEDRTDNERGLRNGKRKGAGPESGDGRGPDVLGSGAEADEGRDGVHEPVYRGGPTLPGQGRRVQKRHRVRQGDAVGSVGGVCGEEPEEGGGDLVRGILD